MLSFIVLLIVIGVLLWLVNTYIPMADSIKKIINIVVIIGVVLMVLQFFGVFGMLDNGFPHYGGGGRYPH
jgi:hypothetical protein